MQKLNFPSFFNAEYLEIRAEFYVTENKSGARSTLSGDTSSILESDSDS